jgi:hypothetical protein
MVRRGENLLFFSNCACGRAKVTSLTRRRGFRSTPDETRNALSRPGRQRWRTRR